MKTLQDWVDYLLTCLSLTADVKFEKLIYAHDGIDYLTKGSGGAAGIDNQYGTLNSKTGKIKFFINDSKHGKVGPLILSLEDFEEFVGVEAIVDVHSAKVEFFAGQKIPVIGNEDGEVETDPELIDKGLEDISEIIQTTLHGIVERGQLKKWSQRVSSNLVLAGGDPQLLPMVLNQAKALTGIYRIQARAGFYAFFDRVLEGLLKALITSLPKVI